MNVVSATEELQSPKVFVVTPAVTASKVFPTSKGFTLKLPQRSSSPVLVSPVSSPLVVTAEKVFHPLPPPQPVSKSVEKIEPTGVVSETFNTQVQDGLTTVHQTKIIGTHIGSQYARIFETSSTILPESTASPVIITPAKSAPALSTVAQAIRTEESVVSDDSSGEVYSDDENDNQQEIQDNYDYDSYSQHLPQHEHSFECKIPSLISLTTQPPHIPIVVKFICSSFENCVK